jgi:hypothetical protein
MARCGNPRDTPWTLRELEGDVVVGRSHFDFGPCFLLVVGGVPLGHSVHDDLGGDRSHLSEVRKTNHLLLYSRQLGFATIPSPTATQQTAGRFLQLRERARDARKVRRVGEVAKVHWATRQMV